MTLNFLLRELTHLRYYIPIIQEGNRRGLKSNFCVVASNKYNCPIKNQDVVLSLSRENNIGLYSGKKKDLNGLFFCNENSGFDWVKKVKAESSCKIVVGTYQTDFVNTYEQYYETADHIMMPSRNIAEFYDLHREKNLYLGIPKYDINLNKHEIIKKYSLDETKKKVLLFWPKTRDIHKFPIDIIDNFDKLGWQVLVKSRAKDPVSDNTRDQLIKNGNALFYDSWYPHTSQELLEVSDLVVNCGSTAIEECVMHEVPVINFDIKPPIRHGVKQKHRVTHSYLYDYNFCLNFKNLDSSFSTAKLNAFINTLLCRDLSKSFKQCKKDWLYDHKNTCKNLLDMLIS